MEIIKCNTCKGSGKLASYRILDKVYYYQNIPDDRSYALINCWNCEGSGRLEVIYKPYKLSEFKKELGK